MQIGQRLVVVQLADLRHEAGENVADLTDDALKVAQGNAVHAVDALADRRVLDQQARGAANPILGRQIGEGQEISALVVTFLSLERGASFLVDQLRHRIGIIAVGIGLRRRTKRLDVDAPARTEPPHRVVQLGACRRQS